MHVRQLVRRMQPIKFAIDAGIPIDQQLLSVLSKGALKQHLQHDSGASDQVEALWHGLVQSTLTQNTTEKYLTASCNCIAVFLSNAVLSPFSHVKHFSISREVWFAAFECVQKALERGKTKPALQVLETLTELQEHMDETSASAYLHESSLRLLNVIFTGQPIHQVKSVCIALSCLVKKTTLLLRLESIVAESLAQSRSAWERHQTQQNIFIGKISGQQSQSPHLFLALLFAVQNLETRSAASKLFALLVNTEDWTFDHSPIRFAAEIIEAFVKDNPTALGDFADNILPVLLNDRLNFEAFSSSCKPGSSLLQSRVMLYLSVLKVGMLKKFLTEDELPHTLNDAFSSSTSLQQPFADDYYLFRILLRSASPSIRIHTYGLLTISFGTTTVVPDSVLHCVITCMRDLHDDNDAFERGEILSITRRLLKRLENGSAAASKIVASKHPMEASATLKAYADFILLLGSFLLRELDPGISYQRHILALQSLRMVVKSSAFAASLNLPSFFCPLYSLILDPFEDVRSTSALVLDDIRQLRPEEFRTTFPLKLLPRMMAISVGSCRHDHADAAGRLSALAPSSPMSFEGAEKAVLPRSPTLTEIIQGLRMHLSVGSIDPNSDYPLHATLLTLVHALTDGFENSIDNGIYAALVEVCANIWRRVQDRLCIDSPERDEDVEDDGMMGPKDLLSYSWRALRDSSLVLQGTLRNLRYNDDETLSRIGQLCLEQLILLRHRGAFSTVAQTFSLCCEKARQAGTPVSKDLNRHWCIAAIEEIENQAKKLTRRSAGLPAMICAVLGPEDPGHFAAVYSTLKAKAGKPVLEAETAQTDLRLPQVHALNCLKDLMMTSKFRAVTEQFVGELLELAATSMASPVWAIRNCGLMLLRACMSRLKPQSSDQSLELSNTDNSGSQLLAVAFNLLGSGTEAVEDPMTRSELIFAGLDLARYIAHGDVNKMNSLILTHLENPAWAIRDRAARLLADQEVIRSNEEEILATYFPPPRCSDNMLHGTLLFFRYVLRGVNSHVEDDDEEETGHTGLVQVAMHMMSRVGAYFENGYSPYTKAALFDILNDVFVRTIAAGEMLQWPYEMINSFQLKIAAADVPDHRFYHSKLILCRVLVTLLGSQIYPDRIQSFDESLLNELVQQPDAVRSVIEHIDDIRTPRIPALVDLLVRLSLAVHETRTRGLLMLALAKYLEANSEALSDQQAVSLQEMTSDHDLWDWNIWNSFTRLEACLIRRHLLRRSDDMSKPLLTRLQALLFTVQAANEDQLDFLTRENAAIALQTCGRHLVARLALAKTSRREELTIEAFSIVYDQLNDDDEEIRNIAEQTASSILGEWQTHSQKTLALCASASRDSVRSTLMERFRGTRKLTMLALRRLMGLGGSKARCPSPSAYSTLSESVSQQLHRVQASLNDLFAEEKQNLYIDEVDEVVQWASVFSCCDLKSLGDQWHSAITEWCAEGLDALTLMMRSSNESDDDRRSTDHVEFHPLDPTYNSEVLVICIRVIKLAQILVKANEDDIGNSMDIDGTTGTEDISHRLIELKSACLKTSAHRRVLDEMDGNPGRIYR